MNLTSKLQKWLLKNMHNSLKKIKINGFEIFVDPLDLGISKALSSPISRFFRRWPREPDFMELLYSELSPTDVAIDLGANIGFMTIHMSKIVNKPSQITAIEPSSRNLRILSENLALNGLAEIKTIQCAVSNHDTTASFYLSKHSNLHSLDGSLNLIPSEVSEQVKVKDAGKLFARLKPNFVKMDVEGAELDIFESIVKKPNILDNLTILVEMHPTLYTDHQRVVKIMRALGKYMSCKYLISATTSSPKPILDRGYFPVKTYSTGGWSRGVYENVSIEDAIDFLCNKDIVNHRRFSMKKMKYVNVTTNKIVRGLVLSSR